MLLFIKYKRYPSTSTKKRFLVRKNFVPTNRNSTHPCLDHRPHSQIDVVAFKLGRPHSRIDALAFNHHFAIVAWILWREWLNYSKLHGGKNSPFSRRQPVFMKTKKGEKEREKRGEREKRKKEEFLT